MDKIAMDKNCLQCGDPLGKVRKTRKYCSPECSTESTRIYKRETNCLFCGEPLTRKQAKYCNTSCSAKINNLGKQRHGKPKHPCAYCSKLILGKKKFCNPQCFGKSIRFNGTHEEKMLQGKRKINESSIRYYARKNYQTPVGADLQKIKEFYVGCPQGYNVDHIIPLSKGGHHDIPNLWYLTKSDNCYKRDKMPSEWLLPMLIRHNIDNPDNVFASALKRLNK